MVAKAVPKPAMPDISEFFSAMQLVVGVSDAVLHLIHLARAALSILLQITSSILKIP